MALLSLTRVWQRMIAVPALALLLITMTMPLTVFAQSAAEYEPDTLLAIVSKDSKPDEIKEALNKVSASMVNDYDLGFLRMLKIKTASGKMDTTAQALNTDKLFHGIQRNWHFSWAQVKPREGEQPAANDPLFPDQWHLFKLNLPASWKVSTPTGEYIAVLDSGCAHVQEMRGKMTAGVATLPKTSYLTDDAPNGGHGTKVATIAAARTNNAKQIAGVNPWAYIYPIKIGNASGTDDEQIILGLAQLIKSGASIGLIGVGAAPSGWTMLNDPIVYGMLGIYREQGGILFAPAGNASMAIKSNLDPNLILVSATDQNGQLTNFSNYGKAIWFGAPGVGIQAIDSSGQTVLINGTSASAAIVAGIASLVWCNNPKMTSTEVLNIMKNSASGKGQHNDQTGYGIIDVQAAVAQVTKPTGGRR
jgi:hypothetical protein